MLIRLLVIMLNSVCNAYIFNNQTSMCFTYKDDTIEEKHHRFQKSKATHFYWMDMTPEEKKITFSHLAHTFIQNGLQVKTIEALKANNM